ncbi:retrotransposon protein, putative, ty1-copia subclass [Tanacetum coccineum]
MHSMGKTIAELHAMLKLHEKGAKGNDKGKNKLAYAPKPMFPSLPKRENLGLKRSKKLKHGALSLYMGNGMRAAIEAIGSFDLILPSGLIILQRDGILQPTHDESLEKCKSCISGKMTHKPFPYKVERAKDLLGLIHTDVCGPFRTVSREGASYFITFTDDFCRYGYVYLMKHKHEVFETFKVFQNEVENQIGKKIKAIRSDRGGEYLSHEFVNHMKSCGIVSQLTLPKTLQHNEGYALESTTRNLNMVPTKKVERTPYEIWHGKALKLSYLRVWGCYPDETLGYYFYYPPENKIFVARNAEFFENSLIIQEASGSHGPLKMSKSDEGLELIHEKDTQPSENSSKEHNEVVSIKVKPQNVEVPIRRSARIPQVPDRYGFYVDFEEHELGDLNEPPNYKAALSDLEYDKWLKAINIEMQSMKENQVWILVELPPNGQTVRSKWLFKKKNDMDDNCFSMKDLGKAAYILRIKIIHDRSKQLIALSQSAYLEKILKRFMMENSKKMYTPMMEKPDYRKSQGARTPSEVQRMQRVPYDSAIGSIMYAVRCTRPDVAFAQNLYSYFQQNPESEYFATAEASMEAVWMRKFIDRLGDVVPSNKRPMEMLCDNEPAITIATNPYILKGVTHFQRKYHYIREVT